MSHLERVNKAGKIRISITKILILTGITIIIISFLIKNWSYFRKTFPENSISQAPISTSRIMEIDSVWTEILLPPHTRFQIDPTTTTIQVKLLNGQVYEKTEGLWYQNGKPTRLPDPIPGFKLSLRSSKPTKVIFSTWPAQSK